MLFHQPVSSDALDETTYFSSDLVTKLPFSETAMKRLMLGSPAAGVANRPSGGYNSGGSQALIFQVPVRAFEAE